MKCDIYSFWTLDDFCFYIVIKLLDPSCLEILVMDQARKVSLAIIGVSQNLLFKDHKLFWPRCAKMDRNDDATTSMA